MQSLTAEENENKTTKEDSVFGQAGRDATSSPPPYRPPSSLETFWSDLKGERSAKYVSFINFKGGV